MSTTLADKSEARIIPALQRLQHEQGYLRRTELARLANELGVPLYEIQAVASFYPHFRLSPPRAVTVRVCRDMACHMAGAEAVLAQLGELAGERVAVEGASCLGRCDRAPAACVSVHQAASEAPGGQTQDYERYYLGRVAGELKKIVRTIAEGGHRPASDHDTHHRPGGGAEAVAHYPSRDWVIDPCPGKREYEAVRKALALRREALRKASAALLSERGWPEERGEMFRLLAASVEGAAKLEADETMAGAYRHWLAADDWASGPELGDWSDAILAELDKGRADLRGLGGAGIPATQKWRDVREALRSARRRGADDHAYIIVNGDESEPGTFKDRELLLHYPHLVIEGMILASLVSGADRGIIYIRHEYAEQIETCRKAIAQAEQLGVCGANARILGYSLVISVFASPGGYICGEQSALVEALSDRRAEPRNMPPKLETNGLHDRPTLVSNVETFAWVPYIWLKGGDAYAALGVNGWRGRRFFSVSGDVKRPGVYEVPMGLTLRELIDGESYCGGMAGDRKLKALAPSGPSGGFLPARLTAKSGLPRNHVTNKTWLALAKRRGFDPNSQELDLLDMELELELFRALSPTQALGAGLVVYAEGRDMAEQAVNAVEFFRNESCGKCVPCRAGSQKLAALGTNLLAGKVSSKSWITELQPTAQDLWQAMELTSICGLGRSVAVPLKTALNLFPQDVAGHLPDEAVAPGDHIPSVRTYPEEGARRNNATESTSPQPSAGLPGEGKMRDAPRTPPKEPR